MRTTPAPAGAQLLALARRWRRCRGSWWRTCSAPPPARRRRWWSRRRARRRVRRESSGRVIAPTLPDVRAEQALPTEPRSPWPCAQNTTGSAEGERNARPTTPCVASGAKRRSGRRSSRALHRRARLEAREVRSRRRSGGRSRRPRGRRSCGRARSGRDRRSGARRDWRSPARRGAARRPAASTPASVVGLGRLARGELHRRLPAQRLLDRAVELGARRRAPPRAPSGWASRA